MVTQSTENNQYSNETHDTSKLALIRELEKANQRIVQLEQEHKAFLKTREALQRANQKIHALEKQLQWRNALDQVPAKVMSQNQKAALNRTVKELQSKEPNPDGWILLENTNELAKDCGMATKTFQKCLTYCNTIDTLSKKTEKVYDKNTGTVIATLTYAKPTELTPYPKMYNAEQDRNHGGERLYCKCGSCRIKKNVKITYTCMDCGEVYNQKPSHFPPVSPEDQFGTTGHNHSFEEERAATPDNRETTMTNTESSFPPEDQFGTTGPEIRKPNLTQFSISPLQDQLDPPEKTAFPLTPPPSVSSLVLIQQWLEKRRGSSRLIQATGKLQADDKYLSKSKSYQPNIEAYIRGQINHIYGSWLRSFQTNTTFVLSFDCDQEEHNNQAQNYLLALARAGAAPIYWQRQRQRGHLEIYFDEPVDPEMARQWAFSVCPELEDIAECYPCQDKRNNALSWPLWQRIDDEVHACTAYALLPAPFAGDLLQVKASDHDQIANLVTKAVTRTVLVEQYIKALQRQSEESVDRPAMRTQGGGVNGKKTLGMNDREGQRDLAKQVIADFNRDYSWEEIASMCGGMIGGKFRAVWRGDETPSVVPDPGGSHYACDYGRTGNFPRKFDKYEAYCLINKLEKRVDLASRCATMRQRLSQAVQRSPLVRDSIVSSSARSIVEEACFQGNEEVEVVSLCLSCLDCERETPAVYEVDGLLCCAEHHPDYQDLVRFTARVTHACPDLCLTEIIRSSQVRGQGRAGV